MTPEILAPDVLAPDILAPGVLELPVAYRDARAADLGLYLDLPRQQALVARSLDVHGWGIELRILGASHQVLATRQGVVVCSETVACRPDDRPGDSSLASRHHRLPRRQHQPGSLGDHAFASRADRLDPETFRRRVDDLVTTLAGCTLALSGRFPGDRWATTGLRVEATSAEELHWSGWHSYPETNEVVTTSSRLVLHGPARRLGVGRHG